MSQPRAAFCSAATTAMTNFSVIGPLSTAGVRRTVTVHLNPTVGLGDCQVVLTLVEAAIQSDSSKR